MDNYFVVHKYRRTDPAVFQGDRTETLWWLLDRKDLGVLEVCNQTTGAYVSAAAFIVTHTTIVEPKGTTDRYARVEPALDSPESKMMHESMTDPHVHARNTLVLQLVMRAMRLVNEPNYDPELLAKNTTHEIIRLFY
jgi:hypothetical protein